MKTVNLCKGLSLTHKRDGTWMNFETETGMFASIQLANTFKVGIISVTITDWAEERLQEETDGN